MPANFLASSRPEGRLPAAVASAASHTAAAAGAAATAPHDSRPASARRAESRIWRSCKKRCVPRFGAAALLAWWVVACPLWLFHLAAVDWNTNKGRISLWKQQLLLGTMVVVSIVVTLPNLMLILWGTDTVGNWTTTPTVCMMLGLALVGRRPLEAVGLKGTSRGLDRWFPESSVCKGPLPLLYVLLICELPASLKSAAGVSFLYVAGSAAAELPGQDPFSDYRNPALHRESPDTWTDAAVFVVLAALAVLRRLCAEMELASGDSAGGVGGMAKLPACQRHFGPATLLLWWLCVVYRLSGLVRTVLAEGQTQEYPLPVHQAYMLGGVAAAAAALGALAALLLAVPDYGERACVEVPLAAGMLLLAVGLHAESSWLPEVAKPVAPLGSLHTGALPPVLVLLVSRVPGDSCTALVVVVAYVTAEGLIAVSAHFDEFETTGEAATVEVSKREVEDYAVTACVAGLSVVRLWCDAIGRSSPDVRLRKPNARPSPMRLRMQRARSPRTLSLLPVPTGRPRPAEEGEADCFLPIAGIGEQWNQEAAPDVEQDRVSRPGSPRAAHARMVATPRVFGATSATIVAAGWGRPVGVDDEGSPQPAPEADEDTEWDTDHGPPEDDKGFRLVRPVRVAPSRVHQVSCDDDGIVDDDDSSDAQAPCPAPAPEVKSSTCISLDDIPDVKSLHLVLLSEIGVQIVTGGSNDSIGFDIDEAAAAMASAQISPPMEILPPEVMVLPEPQETGEEDAEPASQSSALVLADIELEDMHVPRERAAVETEICKEADNLDAPVAVEMETWM